jgi:simple sugar transport system substrate-binding protein
MKKTRYVFVSLAAFALLATSCGSDKNTTSTAATTGATTGAAATTPASAAAAVTTPASAAPADTSAADTVDVTAGQAVTVAVVTHGDGGVFWSVFKKGALQAGKDLGITVNYQESNNSGTKQSDMINQAVADGAQGLAVSLADPDAVKAAVKAAADAGLPIVTTNSGSNLYLQFGAFTHIGQDEFTAGAGAGNRFNDLGAKVLLCAKQEQTNTGLDARCDGAKSTFKGKFLTPITTSGDASGKQQADLKAAIDADPTIDAVFGTGPVVAHDASAAAKELGRTIIIGGVDLSSDILDDIAAGAVAFTIDQQQYLQGYVSVLALYLNITNKNTLGGGLPINTGPGFVDKTNAAAVKDLVAKGTR